MFSKALVIVDPRKILADSLQSMISTKDIFDTVLVAYSSIDALTVALNLNKVVFLVSGISYAQMNHSAQLIQSQYPDGTIVLLDDRYRHGGGLLVRDSIARGYWTLHDSTDHLLEGLVEAVHHRKSISPQLSAFLLHSDEGVKLASEHETHILYSLTQRELQYFLKIAEGKTVSECAREMKITDRSIFNLRERVMKKLEIHSFAELLWKANEFGLINMRHTEAVYIS